MITNVYSTFDKKISRWSLPVITPLNAEQYKEQIRNLVLLGEDKDPGSHDHYFVGTYDDKSGIITYFPEKDFLCCAGEFKNE